MESQIKLSKEAMRFEAAVAAMQGMLAGWGEAPFDRVVCANLAVNHADALLAELDRTRAGK